MLILIALAQGILIALPPVVRIQDHSALVRLFIIEINPVNIEDSVNFLHTTTYRQKLRKLNGFSQKFIKVKEIQSSKAKESRFSTIYSTIF
jgi:hypothetical protein